MKKIKLFLSVLFLGNLTAILSAQPTWEFNKTTWVTENRWGPGPSDHYLYTLHTGYSNSDIIINSVNYKAITYDTSASDYYCAVRSDNHRLYVAWDIDNNSVMEEYLVYDFNANVGDTLQEVYFPSDIATSKVLITYKDSFLVNSKFYTVQKVKKVPFTSSDEYFIWENVGADAGGLFLSTTVSPNGLYCYSNNDSIINVAHNDMNGSDTAWAALGDCLDVISGINKIATNNKVNIFPNPNTGEIEISLGKARLKKVEVYNIAGILLFEKAIDLLNHKLNMEAFSNGIYFIKVEDEYGKIYSEKIIKQ